MNRVTFMLCMVIALVSCERSITKLQINKVCIENQTEQKLTVFNTVTGEYDSQGRDKIEGVDTLYTIINFTLLANEVEQIDPYIEIYYIYNMADTTSCKYNSIRNAGMKNPLEPYIAYDYQKVDKYTSQVETHLTITKATLSLLKKDYSMVENFPEYYEE